MRPLGSADGATPLAESRSRAISRADSQSSSRSGSQESHQPEIPPQTFDPDEHVQEEPQSPEESEPGDFIQVPSDLGDDTGPDLWGRNEELSPLTSEQCLIADPWLMAFDLKAKRWGEKRIPNQAPDVGLEERLTM